MDLGAAYWRAVRDNLSRAAVVFDKFHVVKLVNERLDEVRRQLVGEAERDLKADIKGTRFLLLSRRNNLTPERMCALDAALRANQPLFDAYYLKEELLPLWAQPTAKDMRHFLKAWCRRALATGLAPFRSLVKTLRSRRKGILEWFNHPINSGRMDGINNKVKVMTRSAYGYRDEAFFILKLYNHHHARQELVG